MLQQQLGGNLHRLHLAVVLLHHPLQDAAGLQGLAIGAYGISGEAKPPHQLAGPHLEQLHRRHPLIGG